MTDAPQSPPRAGARQHVLAAAALTALIWLVFAQTARFEFLDYDDKAVVYENELVRGGLTPAGVARAFTQPHFGLYMPVTTLTHLLDVQCFGLRPGGHHLASVAWHNAAVLALYAALVALTGAPWRSLLVAALFAVHPARATSVAWIASRKDLVSGLFFFLGLWAYARYAAKHGVLRYLAVAACYLLALLGKPSAVTFPCVLLLLDWWPLARLRNAKDGASLLAEKLPLFALAALACAGAVWSEHTEGALTAGFPPAYRLGNAVLSYGRYLWHTVWPLDLAIHYPHFRSGLPWAQVALSALALLAITAAVIALHRRRCLTVGWCWFLGTLVPVIGLVQFSNSALADRFLYIPQTGLFIALTWSLPAARARYTGTLGVALVALCVVWAGIETARWRGAETIFRRAIAVTKDNDLAHGKVGEICDAQGKTAEALEHFETAYNINPDSAINCFNLGTVRMDEGRMDEAAALFKHAVQFNPDWPQVYTNLGCAYMNLGNNLAALAPLEHALEIEPDNVNAHINYGAALLRLGRRAEAAKQFLEALRLDPGNPAAQANLKLVRGAGE